MEAVLGQSAVPRVPLRHPTRDALAHIPGEYGWPIVGQTMRMYADPQKFGRTMRARYGDVYKVLSFGVRQVALVGADANELVLFDRDRNFSSEQGWGPILGRLFPGGLMLMDFDAHRVDRRALSVAFKPEPMRHYADRLNEGIAAAMPAWGARQPLIFYKAVKTLTLELAATSFLGLPFGPDADRINRAFVDEVQASVGVVRVPLPFTKMGRGVAARRFLIDYFIPLVRERRANPGQDMFSQFANATREDGALLSEQEVADHMNFLMMAAHDTITSSVTTMAWYLASHGEWQDRLRAEIATVAAPDGTVAYADLPRLELTEMAFKEALRLMAPVPSTPRRAMRDFTFRGYRIPAGTVVGISAGATHMDPAYWDEPTRFDPMRFTPEQVRTRHKYAWIPFSGGAHMCLGLHFAYMQAKILMAHLLTNYRLSAPEGYTPQWQVWPIPRPRDGLPLTLTPLR